MAKLIYAMNTSLDGYVNDRAGSLDWSAPSPEWFAALCELQRPIGTYLYGRALYETMAVWQTAHVTDQPAFMPGLLELEREFATLWRAADKIVFSSTLTEAATPRTRIADALDAGEIRKLKAASDRDLMVGGPRLAAAMIAADLVDDFHAFVHPVSIGGGTPFLPTDRRVELELVGERRLGRALHLHYRRR